MTDGSDQAGGVVVIEPGDGVAEVNRDACGEACGELEDAAFAAGAGEFRQYPKCAHTARLGAKKGGNC